MRQEIIIAGFGGQGVMLIGEILAYAGMLEGKRVSWMPSYGPEMRGGTANCSVVLTDEEDIGVPVVAEPTVVIAMSEPALQKFAPLVVSGGLLIFSEGLAPQNIRKDVVLMEIPATDIAVRLGEARVANMVFLGALVGATGCVSPKAVISSLKEKLPQRYHSLLPVNERAINEGIRLAHKLRGVVGV
ncbi:2-oxoglutarate ferredoxin oxidoreductase subunit gamma [Thermanaeromonas toyohensis ToBE]|uniref:2-oxoglutarate ferredoxin oxidoreductase subunit gamma n=1 Tax=Thermanaeromonas toyohensis ToBE TaxID=698762 RepID=A0A1W1VPH0_9FIRM|nr:2-oxoacid:acceptor oxidoreductase family protein [Thermanaeromonas toyohensis]SMB95275.1 2-oxoglutarate ferredoxin oxidoreductase subunit gamma [Thermanaeromonas toyohensis ToBE]